MASYVYSYQLGHCLEKEITTCKQIALHHLFIYRQGTELQIFLV